MRKTNLSCGGGGDDACTYNNNLIPSSENKKARPADDGNDRAEQEATTTWVQCFLNVTSAIHAKDGFVCVAIQTSSLRSKNSIKQVQNIYVAPQHLRLVRDDDVVAQSKWIKALKYIIL